jgi:hypothetical protein
MSRLFGPLRQMGYVVRDIEKAMHHWSTVCGIGPWYYFEKNTFTKFVYDGKEYNDVHMSAAFANSGEVQVELIQQKCDTPSMWRDFIQSGREGLQHWSSWPENYDELYERALANGYTVGHEGIGGRGRFVYFKQEGHTGTIIEMSHLNPTRKQFFDMVRDAGQNWDGRDPIRRL